MAGSEEAKWNRESLRDTARWLDNVEEYITSEADQPAPRPESRRGLPAPWMCYIADDAAVELDAAAMAANSSIKNLVGMVRLGSDGLTMMAKRQAAVEDHNLAEGFGDLEKALDRPEKEKP